MEPQTIEQKVESLEARVTVLEELPARIDALALQMSQFRDEMRAEFSAMRVEMREGDQAVVRSLREEMRAEFSALRGEIRAGEEETRRVLLEKIEETRRHATMLHEDTLSRIAATQEGKPRLRKRR